MEENEKDKAYVYVNHDYSIIKDVVNAVNIPHNAILALIFLLIFYLSSYTANFIYTNQHTSPNVL